MGDSRREAILQALEVLLDGGGKPTGLTVERGRVRNLEEGHLPHATIHTVDEVPQEGDHDLTIERPLRVRIVWRVKAEGGESSDQALDPFLSWGEQSWLLDPTLGALCTRIRCLRIDWEADELAELSEPFGGALQDFEVEYQTEEADPESGL